MRKNYFTQPKALLTFLLISAFGTNSVFAGDDASPAVDPWYRFPSSSYSDLMVSTVTPVIEANGTFYNSLQINMAQLDEEGNFLRYEDASYMGIQSLYDGKHVSIFSIWNPLVRWNGTEISSNETRAVNDDLITITSGNRIIGTIERSQLKGDSVYCKFWDGVVSFYTYPNDNKADTILLFQSITTTDIKSEDYRDSRGQIKPFDGEGRGLQSLYNFDWKLNQTYSSVVKVWHENEISKVGYWRLDHTNQTWYYGITMIYPEKNMYFGGDAGTFLEDFNDNGANQKAVYVHPLWWRDQSNGKWNASTSFSSISISKGENCKYPNTPDVYGIDSLGVFYLSSGGNVEGNVPDTVNLDEEMYKTIVDNSESQVLFEPIQITDVRLENDSLSWTIREDKLPQFAYKYEVSKKIFDKKNKFVGYEIVSTDSAIQPNCRKVYLPIKEAGEYSISVILTDIFDNKIRTAFPLSINEPEPETTPSCLNMMNDFTVQYGGLLVNVPIDHKNTNLDLRIVDKSGNVLSSWNGLMSVGDNQNSAVLYLNTNNLSFSDDYYFVASIDDQNCKSNFNLGKGVYDGDETITDGNEGIKGVYGLGNDVHIDFESSINTNATVIISSIYGWDAARQTVSLQEGLNKLDIHTNGLSVGIQFIARIIFENGEYSEKFIAK